MSSTNFANPHAATSIGSINLTYNKNGNLTNRSDNVTHVWDYNNRLTKAIIPGTGALVKYLYVFAT